MFLLHSSAVYDIPLRIILIKDDRLKVVSDGKIEASWMAFYEYLSYFYLFT